MPQLEFLSVHGYPVYLHFQKFVFRDIAAILSISSESFRQYA